MTDLDDRLSQGLHRLAAEAPLPTGGDDLARGHRALRRRRGLLAGGAGAAAVAAVAVLAALVPGRGPVAGDPTPVAPAPTVTAPSSAEPSAATPAPRCVEDSRLGDPDGDATQGWQASAPDLLATYRTILAEHLDPGGAHLQRRASGEQTSTSTDPACADGTMRLISYGTKLAWRVPGQDGLGMIQVEVTDGPWRDSQVRMSHDDWQARPVDLPGVESAAVAQYDGGLAVVVHRTDGLSVAIDANTLFGNNSLTPVGSIDLSVDGLIAAAADPRFGLT